MYIIVIFYCSENIQGFIVELYLSCTSLSVFSYDVRKSKASHTKKEKEKKLDMKTLIKLLLL